MYKSNKMTIQDVFQKVKWFKPSENWGDINKIDKNLILSLDSLRDKMSIPLHISPASGSVYAISGHSDESWHYIIKGRNELSMAADIFPENSLLDVFMQAIKMKELGGIGIYPFASWQRKAGPLNGMMHLDVRPYELKTVWWQDVGKRYHYLNKMQDLNEFYHFYKIIGKPKK